MQSKKEITEFEKEWLQMEKYDFKILTLVAVMANEHAAYRGTITHMCQFLGVSSRNSSTTRAIKQSIQNLVDKEYILMIQQGKTYTLTLSTKVEKKRNIIRIQTKWIEIVKATKFGVSWDNILRVWLYLIDNKELLITNRMIADHLCLSESTVEKIKNVLVDKIEAIKCVNKYRKVGETNFTRIGQNIDTFAWIEE